MTLASTSRVYGYAAGATLLWHPLSHDGFRSFNCSLDRLIRALGEDATTDYWQPVLRHLRRYRFDLCAAPLPFDYQSQHAAGSMDIIERQIAYCEKIYPTYAPAAREAASSYARLAVAKDNPMLDSLDVLVQGKRRRPIALLLKESRLIPLAARELSARRLAAFIEPITVSQARGGPAYTAFAVAGPASWFPDDIFTCPRAPEVIVLYFDWIRTNWQPSAMLAGSVAMPQNAVPPPPYCHANSKPELPQDDSASSPAQLLLPPHFDPPHHPLHAGTHNVDDLDARLFLLQGGIGVYLDTQEEATILVLDLEEEGPGQLRRLRANQIEPEMFLLLRTSGGGDYIVPVADKVLGDQAAHARACQELWKTRLRDLVRTQGLLGASIALLDHGSERANEWNTRNWMSPRSIRTEDRADFLAIMRLCGLEERTQELWDVMGTIDNAHRKAGFAIRKQLLQQVESSDLREMVRSGKMEFALPGAGTGSLTAYRVEEVATTPVRIAAARAGHPFELEVW